MTDLLPLIGDDAITILESDHRKIKDWLDALPDAAASERTQLLENLKAAFTIHNATEENLIYPAIREIAGRHIHAGTLYHEQDAAKVLVWELAELEPGDEKFTAKATALRAAVLAHVEQEEQQEFPKLREAAGEAFSRITAKVREFRSALKFSPGGTERRSGELGLVQ